MLAGVALLLGIVAAEINLGYGPVGDAVVAALRALVVASFLWIAAWGVGRLARITAGRPRAGLVVATMALGLGGVYAAGTLIPTPATRVIVFVVLALLAWAGAAAGAVLRDRNRGTHAFRRALLHLGGVGVVGGGMAAWLFLAPGADRAARDLAGATPRPSTLEVGNPAEAGGWPVVSFTYGSGTDRRRPEYADSVFFATPTVDLTPLLPGFSGRDAQAHRNHWGFGLEAIPLNARVWLPAVEGANRPPEPFPLVVVVPGIDPHSERSELGYTYLAELLASRGFVVVALDVNFLGGPRIAARAGEMPVRAWLALEHLRLLHEWQEADPTGIPSLFDLDRIGLVGHSRGGEAVALAAMLNQMGRYPDNASIPLSFGFGIRAVVALAPTDRYFRPTGRATTFADVSYLVLHGSQDGDLVSFFGTGQYQRVRFTGADLRDRTGRPLPSPFRASVYVEGANHANFSTARSGLDHPGIVGFLVNRRDLITPSEQQRVTSVLTSGFLEAALRGEEGYRALFRDPRSAGDWLPDIGFVTRMDDGQTLMLADFDSDLDPSSGTFPGVEVHGRNLVLWREEGLRLRDRNRISQETTVVRLGWRRTESNPGEPAFEIRLPRAPAEGPIVDPGGSLVFSLGSPSPVAGVPDLSVELEARDGARVRLPLTFLGPVARPTEPRLWRVPVLDRLQTRGGEQLLQGFEVPLAVFEVADPGLDLEELAVIRFVFDQVPSGTILLDDVGLRTAAPPRPGPAPGAGPETLTVDAPG